MLLKRKVTSFYLKFDFIKYIKKSLIVIFKECPILCIILILLTLVSSVIPTVQLYITKEVTNHISNIFFNNIDSTNFTIILLMIQALLVLFPLIISSFSRLIVLKSQNFLNYKYGEKIIKKTLEVTYDNFENHEFYNKLQRASNDSGNSISSLFNSILDLLKNLIILSSYIIILFNVSWFFPLIIIIPIGLIIFFNKKLSTLKYKQMIQHSHSDREIKYFENLFREKNSAKEFRIFGHDNFIINKWYKLFWKNKNELFRIEKLGVLIALFPNSVASLATFLSSVIILFGYTNGNNSFTLGDYTSLILLLGSSQIISNTFANTLSSIYNEILLVKSMYEFLDMPTTKVKGEKSFPESLMQGISVQNLTYSYPQSNSKVLNNVSFTINPGEKIVIVGDNGSGKSTLIKCILGLLIPKKGAVFFDELEVSNYDEKDFFKNVSVLFQDFIKYSLTVRENISIGDISKLNDNMHLENILKQTDIHNFITSLPKKLDTQLGSIFNEGQDLSGGQWQKIAFARMLLKKSQVLILDEPTASLDPISEMNLFDHFKELSQGKTAIFVSHRLHVCLDADRIIVMKQGKIIEQGTHNELMKLNSEYSKMFRSQANPYDSNRKTEFVGRIF